MAPSDTDEEADAIEDIDFDLRSSDAEDVNDEDVLDAEGDADEGTEADDASVSDDSEDDEDDEDDEDEEDPSGEIAEELGRVGGEIPQHAPNEQTSMQSEGKPPKVLTPEQRVRSLSPARIRRSKLYPSVKTPRSYTVEAICAIAHPEPTHSLAASMCMTHLLTGSQDGYIRDYDIFAAVNGKNFLTAPQRHHCGVVEGTMKSGQLRTWWENPADPSNAYSPTEETALSPVYSMLMQSDALWALAGTQHGHINLFTVRHDPGRFITAMQGHRGPVSCLSMQHDEKGFFSSGWDGDTYQWDLNTGHSVRKFYSTGAQVAIVAVRPYTSWTPPRINSTSMSISTRPDVNGPAARKYSGTGPAGVSSGGRNSSGTGQMKQETGQDDQEDGKSDASYDPLFDDEPDADGEADNDNTQSSNFSQMTTQPASLPGMAGSSSFMPSAKTADSKSSISHSRGPPTLDSAAYAEYSADVLMTASIDGQVVLWDRRVNTPGKGVGRLEMSDKTPPWCVSACWSVDGGQVYAGRRNGTVDVWDTRQFGRAGGGTPRLLKTLRNPVSSGAVSCIVAFPDGHHIACASNDNIRLWNAGESGDPDSTTKVRSGVQFKIIPGHHGGQVSQILVDPASRFMVSASSNRGWHGDSTRTILVHDIKHVV